MQVKNFFENRLSSGENTYTEYRIIKNLSSLQADSGEYSRPITLYCVHYWLIKYQVVCLCVCTQNWLAAGEDSTDFFVKYKSVFRNSAASLAFCAVWAYLNRKGAANYSVKMSYWDQPRMLISSRGQRGMEAKFQDRVLVYGLTVLLWFEPDILQSVGYVIMIMMMKVYWRRIGFNSSI